MADNADELVPKDPNGDSWESPTDPSSPEPVSDGFRASFWRTVFFVLARMGRLPEETRPRVERPAGKRFRSLVVLCFLLGLLSIELTSVLCRPVKPEAGLIALPIWFVLGWIQIRCLIGTSRWFVAPGSLGEEERETAVAWSEYLAAPLSFLVFLVPLPCVAALGNPALTATAAGCGWLAVLAVLGLWYAVLVRSFTSAERLSRRRAVASAVGLLLVWGAVLALFVFLPACVIMWLLLYGSLC